MDSKKHSSLPIFFALNLLLYALVPTRGTYTSCDQPPISTPSPSSCLSSDQTLILGPSTSSGPGGHSPSCGPSSDQTPSPIPYPSSASCGFCPSSGPSGDQTPSHGPIPSSGPTPRPVPSVPSGPIPSSGSSGDQTPSPSPSPSSESPWCPLSSLKLHACNHVLKYLGNPILGKLLVKPCCSLFLGLADAEAAKCLCTLLKEKLLGKQLNIPIGMSFTMLTNFCSWQVPVGFQCA